MKTTHTKNDWLQYFPFAEPRQEQEIAINFILDQFASGKKYVCADLATGIGKSAIAVTVARYLQGNSYILTTQKILQDQYEKDFGDASKLKVLKNIKSSSNYQCSFYCNQSCGDSKRVLKSLENQLKDTDFYRNCAYQCVYTKAKKAFVEHDLGITNFSYFLAETAYAGALTTRDLLIIDECHTIEQALSANVEIAFSENFSNRILRIKNFPTSSKQSELFSWISDVYVKAIKKQVTVTTKSILKCYNEDDQSEIEALSKQLTFLDKHLCKVNRFIKSYDENNWVVNISQTDKHKSKRIEFKPVDISTFAHDSLFAYGQKVLMLSATIINKDAFCRSVGLNPQDVGYIHMVCPFPKENRLVHVLPVGKMSYSNIDKTLPLMAEMIKTLLEQHANDKGLIHCVSFKIAKYLTENIKSARLLTHDSTNREKILKQHKEGTEPTVLVSPSMAEGVDLSDDASRFQILCKVPFPPLQDELVKKRMNRDSQWYPYQTLKTIIQSLGRSIRNENDYAISYILDEDWLTFHQRNKKLFSDDFLEILR